MDKSIITSVMSQQSKTLAQSLDETSTSGLGKFGIQPELLANMGFLKPGIIDFKSTSVEQAFSLMKDPAMFVGKDGINSMTDMLSSEKVQGDLVKKGMGFADNALKQSGILTGAESAFDTATMLGSSMVASPAAIAEWVNGAGDTALNSAIELTGKASQFATDLAEGPAKDVLDAVTSDSGPLKGLTNAVNNVDLSALDGAVDSIVSNIKIPSVSAISDAVKKAIDPSVILKQAKGLIPEIPDLAGLTSGIEDAVGGIGSAISTLTSDEGIVDTFASASDTLFNTPTGFDAKGNPLYSASSTMLSAGGGYLVGNFAKDALLSKVPPGVQLISRFI